MDILSIALSKKGGSSQASSVLEALSKEAVRVDTTTAAEYEFVEESDIQDIRSSISNMRGATPIQATGTGYVLTPNIGVTSTYTVMETTNSNYQYWIIPCEKGDMFTITGHAIVIDGSVKENAVMYAHINESNVSVHRSSTSKKEMDNYIYIADAKGKFCVNLDNSYDGQTWVSKASSLSTLTALGESDVDDVQINGTSIVSDGTANIPLASALSFGVVKQGYGITIGTNGMIHTNPATEDVVTSRQSSYSPIVPSRLNFAVKASLTDDNRITGLTNSQKKNACESLGAELMHGNAQLIVSTTTTEDVDSLHFDFGDNEGYRALLIKTYTHRASASDTLMCLFNNTQRSTDQSKPILPINGGLQSNDTITRFAVAMSIGGNLVGFSHGSGSTNAAGAVNIQGSCTSLGQNNVGTFKSVLFFGVNGTKIPANSSFKIYGVKGGVI